ncbi:tyrosine-type recombinase/integrase [Granulicella sp. L46]|uniref:tyrosine-type recombinase/integrase n=1 Tax=Granulicella sp. L46 TaxID=1641865 RepID=UPI00131C5A09|nr:tyrosine-type recombinase/integrase [Granulicella sp. L46]
MRHHFTRDEIKTLLEGVPNTRNRLMLLVGYNHGLRVSELTNLKGADIRDGYVIVKRLKGSLKTVQPYVQHVDPTFNEAPGLQELARTVGPQERLFPMTPNGVAKLMQRTGARVGLPRHKLFPHNLKHSIAHATIQGAGIENVRQWLGHKSISSTGAYLRVTDEAAAQAIAKAL